MEGQAPAMRLPAKWLVLGMAFSKFIGLVTAAVVAVVSAGSVKAADTAVPHRGAPPAMQAPQPQAASWCADHVLGRLSEQQRLEGHNLQRLKAAQAELAPGFEAGAATTEVRLIAAYQEELEKRRPNIDLSASYLATASAVPITAGRLRQVNALLCVSTTSALAKAIGSAAEAQRRQMAR